MNYIEILSKVMKNLLFHLKAVKTGTVPTKLKSEPAPEPERKLFESLSRSRIK
jgi:hypothetical protein